MNQALKDELARLLDGTTKGVPQAASAVDPTTMADVAAQHWNLLREDLPFPAAVIRLSALNNNLEWMERYAAEHGVLLAPHGKTTMAPQLFDLQLKHGAWGITVATVHQLRVCRRFGIERVFLANQLIGRQDIRYVREELSRDPDFEFFCLVDSIEGVGAPPARLTHPIPAIPINVLVEVGIPGGRCGCRTLEEAVAVVDAAVQSASVSLRGIECYEGIAASHRTVEDTNRIDAFFDLFGLVYDYCLAHHRFDPKESHHIERRRFGVFRHRRTRAWASGRRRHARPAAKRVLSHARFGVLPPTGGDNSTCAAPNMATWISACSRRWRCGARSSPFRKTGLAIVNVGKTGHLSRHRPALRSIPLCDRAWMRAPVELGDDWTVNALNDQHAYLGVPADADVAVGDLDRFRHLPSLHHVRQVAADLAGGRRLPRGRRGLDVLLASVHRT